MKYVNLPPVWMAGFMLLAWGISRMTPPGPEWLVHPGWTLVATGAAVAIWGIVTLRRAGTTVIPGERPNALAEAGPFRFSRNPIYLSDLLFVAGLALILRAPWAVFLVVPFQQVLQRLFILPEEAVLEQDLGQPYRDYKARVRRWI